MKNIIITTMIALAMSASSSFADTGNDKATRATKLYKEGLVSMQQGKYDNATRCFREVIKLYPKHTQARRHLTYVLNNRKSLETAKRKNALKTIKVPRVDLADATVSESIEFLSAVVKRESKGKVAPNMIVQDPTGAFKSRKVNLSLTNIPADTLLKYITDQAYATVRFDKHAIVISPTARAPRKTPAAVE